MAHATKKSNRRQQKRSRDAFAEDEIHEGEYENPGPRVDPDAARIAAMISDIKKRPGPTGFVVKWSPKWLKRANAVANEAAVHALAETQRQANKPIEANDVKGLLVHMPQLSKLEARQRIASERAMRVQMAGDNVRTTQLALQQSADAGAFAIYFFEDKLAVDLFDRQQADGAELDAQGWGLTPLQQIESGLKSRLCSERGILYFALGPDDEFDKVQLAAKMNMLTFKKSGQQAGRKAAQSQDGITEEEIV